MRHQAAGARAPAARTCRGRAASPTGDARRRPLELRDRLLRIYLLAWVIIGIFRGLTSAGAPTRVADPDPVLPFPGVPRT